MSVGVGGDGLRCAGTGGDGTKILFPCRSLSIHVPILYSVSEMNYEIGLQTQVFFLHAQVYLMPR